MLYNACGLIILILPTKMRMITIIIVSYNSCDVMQKCQDELLASNRFRIIVVDNASADNSGARLKDLYPHIEVVTLPQNIGYGRATNVALDMVDTPYAFLINPDLYVTPEDIDNLLKTAKKHEGDATVIAPAVKESDYTQSGMVEKEWVIGAAMLFDMGLLKKVGFFDENYFLFYEEKDLCYRIKQGGGKILLDSDLFFKHLKGQACEPSKKVTYLKNWHIGWSSFYYLSKFDLQFGKHRPDVLLARYYMKAYVSKDAETRFKFKARIAGIQAFLKDEKAFLDNGTPQASPS